MLPCVLDELVLCTKKPLVRRHGNHVRVTSRTQALSPVCTKLGGLRKCPMTIRFIEQVLLGSAQ